MSKLTIAFLILALPAAAQRPGEFEGRQAIVASNDKLELIILTNGGAMADLVLKDDPERLSPMWNPSRMAREAGSAPWTGASLGHFVCVDGFGPVSEQERAAGLQGHGEAHRLPWETIRSEKAAGVTTVAFRVHLPLVQEVLTRTHRLVDGENVVYVDSELESLLAFDRPVVWAEHATIGSPFLAPEKTVVDMSATRAQTRSYPGRPGPRPHRVAPGRDFIWPMAPGVDGGVVDVRAAPAKPDSMEHTTCLMDPERRLAWITALNLEKRLMLGYVFRREEFPWVQSWDNYPPTLRLARGLEFSTQPYDVPRREAISMGTLFGAPTYRWLPAKSKIEARFLMFYVRAPEGFTKVDEVRLENGVLTIEDRAAGKKIVLKASLPI